MHKAVLAPVEETRESSAVDLVPRVGDDMKVIVDGLKKGGINQRVGFRFGSGWIHHSSHLEELWTLWAGLVFRHESRYVKQAIVSKKTRYDVRLECR